MRTAIFCFVSLILGVTTAAFAGDRGYIFVPDGANFFVYSRGTETFILSRARIGERDYNGVINRLSSGKRINSASDDPAGLAVAEKMDSMLEQTMRESMNDQDMRNLFNFIESVIGQDQAIIQRIRELAVSATNSILGPDDREIIQEEINQLLAQVNMNAKFSQFNTVLVVPELTSEKLGLDMIDVIHRPEDAIGLCDSALKALTVKRVIQGVKANILTFRIEGRSYYFMNIQSAESRITDQDMAEGVSELIRNSVLIKTRYGILMQGK